MIKTKTQVGYFKNGNPRLRFRDPNSQSKMVGLEIFPHPTCEVRGSGDCECLHPIFHMASEKWEVGLKREFPFVKYPTPDRVTRILSHASGLPSMYSSVLFCVSMIGSCISSSLARLSRYFAHSLLFYTLGTAYDILYRVTHHLVTWVC